jgi:hypothetical protein
MTQDAEWERKNTPGTARTGGCPKNKHWSSWSGGWVFRPHIYEMVSKKQNKRTLKWTVTLRCKHCGVRIRNTMTEPQVIEQHGYNFLQGLIGKNK